MKKIIFHLVIISVSGILLYGQDIKKTDSKFDQFTSKTGTIMKFIDYNLTNLEFIMGGAFSMIRKTIVNNEQQYFYRISFFGGGSNTSIAHNDFLEMVNALQELKNTSIQDLDLHPYYIENKFVTEDGFEIGYVIDKDKLHWYAVDHKNIIIKMMFFKNYDTLENSINLAKQKFNSLMN